MLYHRLCDDGAMLTPDEVRAALPAPHRQIIDGLVAFAAADPRFRFVELCCSAARGAADELSDLDLGLGVRDDSWPEATEAILPGLRGIGEVVDALEHRIAEWGERPHLRVFVQFATGVQVDLVALPASTRTGLPPGSVALHDPDGRLATPMDPPIRTASATDVAEWTFLAWVALLDLDKYVRRGSGWEALERLGEARGHVWRLIAVARGIDYPAYGLTALLDAPGNPGLPPEMGETVATLEVARLRRAARSLGSRLEEASARASRVMGVPLPHPDLAAYASERLGRG
jgi:hypothetical protein